MTAKERRQEYKRRGLCVDCLHLNDREGYYLCTICHRITYLNRRIKNVANFIKHYQRLLPQLRHERILLKEKKRNG